MQEYKPNATCKPWAEIYEGLKKPFPKEALSAVPGPGAGFTSIKAQYVVERLNEVVGPLNWRHMGKYEPMDENGYVLFLGELVIYGIEGATQQAGVGGSTTAGRKNLNDAWKGAKTDSLSKCASLFGLGNDVFKGLVAPPGQSRGRNVKAVGSTEDF